MSPTQNFPSMGGKRLRHYPHKISPPWEEYNVILCNYITGVNQLRNHKQLLCQSSQTNYAALALAQRE